METTIPRDPDRSLVHSDHGVSWCVLCGWQGVPTSVRGELQHWCPSCSEPLVDGVDLAPERPKVGRNAPCPCGSGKKHKKCCLGV